MIPVDFFAFWCIDKIYVNVKSQHTIIVQINQVFELSR
jgi:hypothetical protein